MTFSTYSVNYIKRENRLQLTFILLLTTVTFKFAVNSSLPRISYLTTLVSCRPIYYLGVVSTILNSCDAPHFESAAEIVH